MQVFFKCVYEREEGTSSPNHHTSDLLVIAFVTPMYIAAIVITHQGVNLRGTFLM